MSTKTWQGRTGKVTTDPKYIPATRGLTKWVNTMAGRKDLTVRVLSRTSDAPARFIQSEAVIDYNESIMIRIDPKIAGSQEFVCLHPTEAGLAVHEACHARASYLLNLPRIAKTYGGRHAEIFQILEESRCERQGYPHLTTVEQYALQSSVLNLILGDLDNETGEEKVMQARTKMVLRTLGLIAGRMDAGILDPTLPKSALIKTALEKALGEKWLNQFWNVGAAFSKCVVEHWNTQEEEMHRLVGVWINLEDELLKERKENEEPQEGGCVLPGDPKGEKEGEGEGKGQGKGEKEGEGEGTGGQGKQQGEGEGEKEEGKGGGGNRSGGEEGKEEGEGKNGDKTGEKKNTPVGDDDDGVEGDGSRILSLLEEGGEGASLGQYKGGTQADLDDAVEIIRSIREAVSEVQSVTGSRLGVEIKAVHKSNAQAHQQRRQRAAEAKKKWN